MYNCFIMNMYKFAINIFCLLVGLPKAPLTANVTVVKVTVVRISWQHSPDDFENDPLTYAVDCFRCTSSKDKNCKEPCNPGIEYSPSKENISGVEVTINGLPPSSYLLFRVYSMNELNQLEPNRDVWNFAKVFVKTKGMKLKSIILTCVYSYSFKLKFYLGPFCTGKKVVYSGRQIFCHHQHSTSASVVCHDLTNLAKADKSSSHLQNLLWVKSGQID